MYSIESKGKSTSIFFCEVLLKDARTHSGHPYGNKIILLLSNYSLDFLP